jgi:hypothetical protein
MKRILLVPTYNYLCDPLLDRIHDIYTGGRFHWIDIEEPRADYGKISSPRIPIESRYLLKSSTFNGFQNEKQKKTLLRHLNEINPDVIITFSDATVFARFIKNTVYEKRVIVIQPCLLDLTKNSLKLSFLYLIRKIANLFLARGGLKDQNKWGATLRNATLFVWSDIEKKFIEGNGGENRVIKSGSGLADFPKKKGLATSSDVIVIAPDFNFYESAGMVSNYFNSLQVIVEYFDKYNFKIKYHPLNKINVRKMKGVEVVSNLDNSIIESAKFIVSGVSNLVITSSFLNKNIFILDSKKYENPYITQENFFHFNRDDLIGSCDNLAGKFNVITDFSSVFSPSDDFKEWIRCQ